MSDPLWVYRPPPPAECSAVPKPKTYYEQHLTNEEPIILGEFKHDRFIWTTRVLRRILPYYFDLLHSFRLPYRSYRVSVDGFHCYLHVPDSHRKCDVDRIYMPRVRAGKYHPYQSFKHRSRASSRALDRLEFLEEECKKQRVKFDYLVKIDLTLPKPVSMRWGSGETQDQINVAVRAFLEKLHEELFPGHQSRFGVMKNPHFWATKTPLEPHRHVHLNVPNVTYNKNTGMFHRFRPWIEADTVRDCWQHALEENGLWADVPDDVRPDVYVGYIKFSDREKVINRLSYCARKPIEDLATNLTQEQLFDFDKEFARFLLDYTPRRINLGFMCNLKRFGYSRKPSSLRCPVCGGEMVLERDEHGEVVVYDRPPPDVPALFQERTGEWLRLPSQG